MIGDGGNPNFCAGTLSFSYFRLVVVTTPSGTVASDTHLLLAPGAEVCVAPPA